MSRTRRFASAKHRTASAFRSHLRRTRVFVTRALSIVLIASILAVQTPAAASQMLIADAASVHANASFWFVASGWSESLTRFFTGQDARPKPEKKEKQKDRDARVAQITISPGGDNLSIPVGGRIQFAAVALDNQGASVGGVKTKWRTQGLEGNKRSRISPRGEFEARHVGAYTVTAEAAGQSASVQVQVVAGAPAVRPGVTPVKVKQLSTREQTTRAEEAPSTEATEVTKNTQPPVSRPKRESSKSPFVKAAYSRPTKSGTLAKSSSTATAATMMLQQESYWDDYNWRSPDDPGNQIGDPPGSPADGGAGNGNFQIAAPVLGLDGRGIDIALALAYNSRVWNKAGSEISFDIDKGFPSPGWSLGFGKVSFMGVNGGSMLSEADGTRHGYGGTLSSYANQCGNSNPNSCRYLSISHAGNTIDGTFINYNSHFSLSYGTVTGGSATASFPNGTTVYYGAFGQGAVYPTYIQDANGNVITVTYRNNQGPNIETITDTLGRTIQFHYANNLLTAITAPGLGAAGARRTLVRLVYQPLVLSYAFSGLTPRGPANNSQITVLKAIYYPGTNTGYWFGDADSYSSYGMLKKVVEHRAMTFYGNVNDLTALGDVGAGAMTQQLDYDYPAGPVSGLTDAPHYRKQTHTWDKMTGEPAATSETNYQIVENATDAPSGIPSSKTTVVQPNGTKSIQWSYNLAETHPDKFKDGLIYMDETRDGADNLLSKSEVTWEKGDYDSPRPIVTRATNGEINQTTKTVLSYGAKYNQVIRAVDYNYGETQVLRVTKTEYENSPTYTNRHIFNLVKATEVWNATEDVRQSRIEYQYDGGTLMDAPGVTQHNSASNPYAQCPVQIEDPNDPDLNGSQSSYCWDWYNQWYQNGCDGYVSTYDDPSGATELCPIDESRRYRGNVTQVTTYANAVNLTEAISETRSYDITGNLRTASTACCEQMTINYSDDTYYAYPESQTKGSPTDANKQVTTSAIYDFNTGLVTEAKDADGLLSATQYDAVTLRPVSTTSSTGATSFFDYNDNESKITETARLGGVTSAIAAQSTKYLNGLGGVRREEALGDNAVDVVETEYDNLGRAFRQSRPFRGNPTRLWTTSYFDRLGRTYKVVAPDGSTSYAFYNYQDPDGVRNPTRPDAATLGVGETTISVDPWGRERWGRIDAQGRLVEVVEPNPNGNGAVTNGGQRTEYDYDLLGRLTQVRQGTDANPNGLQTRRFAYDSLGRLTRQKLAETQATINDDGVHVGVNGAGAMWSDAFAYDTRSNMTQRTDARGIKTIFAYNNDALNRLQGVSYTVPQGSSVPAAASVTYTYLTKQEARAVTGSTQTAAGDITKLKSVTAAGVSSESYGYDGQARVNSHSQTVLGRPAFTTNYIFDALDRVTDIQYPAQYGAQGSPRKVVHHDYDVASRLSQLKVGTQVGGTDGALYASGIAYNAASQTTQMTVGSGGNQVTESYAYDQQTGLLNNQKVMRGATRLLDLSYDYLRAGTTQGRTGHLTKITNELDAGKNRHYAYDALGRLTDVGGGGASLSAAVWKQRYGYDRFGNRTSVQVGSEIAKVTKPTEPKAESPTRQLALKHTIELPDELKASNSDKTSSADKLQPISDSPFSIFNSGDEERVIANRATTAPRDETANTGETATANTDETETASSDTTEAAHKTTETTAETAAESASPSAMTSRPVEAISSKSNNLTPLTTAATATFVRTDATTQGNWQGVYGTEGYHAVNIGLNNPAYAPNAAPIGGNGLGGYEWVGSTGDTRALQKVGSGDRVAATWYQSPQMTVDLQITDGQTHQVALYCLDWDGNNARAQTIEVIDAVSGAVLDTRTVSSFSTGKYVVWRVSGNIRVRVTQTGIANVVIAGIFWDSPPAVSAANYYRLVARHSNKCAEVPGATTSPIQLTQQECAGGGAATHQQWQFVSVGDGYYKIIARHSGLGMNVMYGEAGDGLPVIQYPYTGTPNEQWRLVAVGGGYYRIVARHSGKVLDVSGYSTANGAGLWQWTGAAGATNQEWRLEVAGEVPGANVPRDGHAALSYDTATNRLTTGGFEYDAAGNQTRAKRADGSFQRMTYDAANRLVEVRNDANTVVYESYRYGVGNGRVTSESSGVRTYYAGGGGQASIEYVEAVSGGSLVWSKSFIYAGGSVLATISPNGASELVEYHHPDRLGTRLLTNNQNTNIQEQETLPFGAALSIGSTRQFTSYDRSSATGLDYALNRRYDSAQGRFTQVDPIGMSAASLADPQTLNLYAYCGNDPVNHVDPDGLFFKKFFKWLSKALKWIAIAAMVAVLVLSAVVAPGSTGILAKVFAKLVWVLGKIGLATKFSSAALALQAGTATFGGMMAAVGVAAGGAQALLAASAAAGAISRNLQERRRSGQQEKPADERPQFMKPVSLFDTLKLFEKTPEELARDEKYRKCWEAEVEKLKQQFRPELERIMNRGLRNTVLGGLGGAGGGTIVSPRASGGMIGINIGILTQLPGWYDAVQDFEREKLGPAREAAKKRCREQSDM